jgi:DNA polymerase I-like protein with 3'-5' exonuclease and polymerase domains
MLNQAINYPIQSLASDVTAAAIVKIEEELLSLRRLSYSEYVQMLTESRRKYLTNPPDRGIINTIRPLYDMTVCFNEVHDDLVFDLHPDYEKRDEELIIETMRDVTLLKKLVPSFDLKLKVGVKKGPRWGQKE